MMKRNNMTLPTLTARQRWTSRSSLDQSLSLRIIHTMYTLFSWRVHLHAKPAHNSSSSVVLFWKWFVNIHTYWSVAVTDGARFDRPLVLMNGCGPTAEVACKRLLNCLSCLWLSVFVDSEIWWTRSDSVIRTHWCCRMKTRQQAVDWVHAATLSRWCVLLTMSLKSSRLTVSLANTHFDLMQQ